MNKDTGNALWTMLHAYAKGYADTPDTDDISNAGFWLSVFTKLVEEKSAGCRCKQEWDTIMGRCPPPLQDKAAFYLWTLAAHDRVNRKLGKPLHLPHLTLQHELLTSS